MQTFNKFVAALLAVLFIFAAVSALFMFNLERRAFSAQTYQEVFANEGFYNRLPSVMADALLASTSGQSGIPFMLKGLPRQDLENFLRAILPADVLKIVGDNALVSVFAYINKQTDSVQVTLVPLKNNVASDTSLSAVYGLLANQPPCTLDQLMTMGTLLAQQQITFCNPPPELQPLLTPVLQAQLQALAASLPDSVTLAATNPQQGNDPRDQLRLLRIVMKFSPLFALAVLFALSIWLVAFIPNLLDWLGISFATSGGLAFVGALISGPIFRTLLQEILAKYMPRFVPALLLDYTGDFASAITSKFLNPVIWEGLLLVVIGMGLLALSFIVKQRGRLF